MELKRLLRNVLEIKKIILLACILLCSACLSSAKIGDKLIGKTKSNIIKCWGSPIRTVVHGEQGEILIYGEQVFINAHRGGRLA
ncbi:hypothetical protein CLU81_0599 [Flavobacterium sp. 9]|nr:hypothetical protein CLU81_0599 [Flavobacterium sp. 9]